MKCDCCNNENNELHDEKKPPDFLYKYYPPCTIQPITELTLKLTPPDEFNDPFEFKPSTVNLNRAQQKIFDRFPREFCICCFSSVPDNILMWSHYAKAHTGYVVKYAIPEAIGNTTLLPADYSPERLSLPSAPQRDVLFDAFFKVTVRKHCGWKYESEWRAFFHRLNCKDEFCKGKRIYTRPVPPHAVKEVIFGVKSQNDKNKRAILDKLRSTP